MTHAPTGADCSFETETLVSLHFPASRLHVWCFLSKLCLPAGLRLCRFKSNLRHGPEGVSVEEGLWVYRGDWREDVR